MVWHPSKYAEMLAEKIRLHDARVWLVNTGWSGGPYGVGERFSLKYTRAIIDGIHDGALYDAPVERDPRFGFDVVTECPGVPGEVMVPRQAWADGAAYDEQAEQLAELFKANFTNFEEGTAEAIKGAGPV
jgi:phosphoenolpyruvate carboxykinase (ATP)